MSMSKTWSLNMLVTLDMDRYGLKSLAELLGVWQEIIE